MSLKKNKNSLFILSQIVLLALAGCGENASDDAQSETAIFQSSDESVQNESGTIQNGSQNGEKSDLQNQSAATDETSKKIEPLPVMYTDQASDNMPDGEYAVSFVSSDLTKTDEGYRLKLKFYEYDRYSMKDIEGLKQGDVIDITVYEYENGESVSVRKNMTVESVVFTENDEGQITAAMINNGIEENGAELMLNMETGEFENLMWDIYPVYYSIGEGTIPISEYMTFQDCIDYDKLPDGEITYYDDLPESITEAEEKGEFNNGAMRVVIRNGEIVQIIRIFTP